MPSVETWHTRPSPGQAKKRGYGGSGDMGKIPLAPFPIYFVKVHQLGESSRIQLLAPVSVLLVSLKATRS